MNALLLLALLSALWCALHSLLIHPPVTAWLRRRLGDAFRFYRIAYNLFALLTLLPLLAYARSMQGPVWFDWSGPWRVPQALMLGTGVLLFLLGARRYDARRFLGLAQLKEQDAGGGLARSGALDTGGILGVVRHPWYSGLLLVLWARPLADADLVLNTVFSAYLVIGARLEERKLIAEFGERYRAYQREVSMLVPLRWLRRRLTGSGRG